MTIRPLNWAQNLTISAWLAFMHLLNICRTLLSDVLYRIQFSKEKNTTDLQFE